MKRKLRFGLQLDFRNPEQWRRPWGRFYEEMIEFAVWTERLGFDDVWLSEHHAAEDGYLPSPFIAATAIAARTKKIRIGTAIAVAAMYHPVRLAEDCAVLDIISGGRLDVGLGLGYRAEEFEGYGLALSERGKRADEILQIVRRLWDGETLTFEGAHFNLRGARVTPGPLQDRVPLWVGGFNAPAFRRAALYADGIIGGGDMAERWRGYHQALSDAGRDPASARLLCGMQWLLVSEDPERTWTEVAPHVLHQLNTYARWLKGALPEAFKPLDLAGLKADGALKVLTPDAAIRLIETTADEAPIEGVYGFMPPAGFPLDKLAPYVELFANKVIPAFRGGAAAGGRAKAGG